MPKLADFRCSWCGKIYRDEPLEQPPECFSCDDCDTLGRVERFYATEGNFILDGKDFYSTETKSGKYKRTRTAEENVSRGKDV